MAARLNAYLNELGLTQYRRLFESNQVTMPILRSLNDESLAVIGITNAEHRQSLIGGKSAPDTSSTPKESAQFHDQAEAVRYQTTVITSDSNQASNEGMKVIITAQHVQVGSHAVALKDLQSASVSSNEEWINAQNAKLEHGSSIVRWIGLVLLILDAVAIYYWQDIPKFFHSLIDVFVWSWVPPVLLTLIGLPMISDRPLRLHEPSYSVETVSNKNENLLWTKSADQADEIAAAINESLA